MLPGPSSGTYRYRRTMSQRQAHRPFIIGVAGGTASGKTSVCECILSTPVCQHCNNLLCDLSSHEDQRATLEAFTSDVGAFAGTKIIADLRQDKEFRV